MFGFSKINRPNTCPIPEESRKEFEHSFQYLLNKFGIENTWNRSVLLPQPSDFPIKYDGTIQNAYDTLKIISNQMEIPFDNIDLTFFSNDPSIIASGSVHNTGIILNEGVSKSGATGLFHGISESGSYGISIEYSEILNPENMVATLAHELAHVKLFDQIDNEYDDEKLTELTTILFGLGVFNSNAAFQDSRDSNSYSWSRRGYLSQMEWGYALALFAHIRNEDSPNWLKYLTLNIKADFIQGQNFIRTYPEQIFED